ncbi:uncharacterized protein BDW43DRAFT_241294 [Aspergillus alliaceus]|uniref:uncharacterized protein n=1 Tax=Petromyces alliaceus TaxID=209559 RepID=UPI0012A49D34|nr:uncharacterized protein BDW43DRAFT_241294 [Aspergillus alliaceus]KAB8236645.1 hypothetical protein BDW43DRAFT_241294 [Aspergillus alliaceus]
MAPKSDLLLWLYLLVAAALANQAPPNSDICFASNKALPRENYDACCPSKSQSGTGYVGDFQFRYQCGLTPDPAGEEVPHKVGSILDCATLCAENTDCKAGTWDYQYGRCYLTTNMSGTKPSPLWVLLEKSAKSDCQKVEAALRQCKMAEDTCQSLNSQLQLERDTAVEHYNTCQTTSTQIQQERDTAVSNLNTCEKTNSDLLVEKNTAVSNYNTALENYHTCESAKARLQQERDTAVTNYNNCQAHVSQVETAVLNPLTSSIRVGPTIYALFRQKTFSRHNFYSFSSSSFYDCSTACSARPECRGLVYGYADKSCWLFSEYQNPPVVTATYPNVIAAVPL